jgi:hypothetical protein
LLAGIDPADYWNSIVDAVEKRDGYFAPGDNVRLEFEDGATLEVPKFDEHQAAVTLDALDGHFVRAVETLTVKSGTIPRVVDGALRAIRLRKRGKLTNILRSVSTVLGGNTRGWIAPREEDRPDWWLPDLAGLSDARRAISWLSTWSNHSVRVTGYGVTTPTARLASKAPDGKDDNPTQEWFHWLELSVGTEGRRLRICPELLARLSTYAVFRPRNLELLMTLRSRALEWVKTVQLPYQDAALVLPGSIAFACCLSAQEASAMDLLGSRAMESAVKASASIQAGEPELALTWADQTRKWLGRALPSVGRDFMASPWNRKVLFPRGT